MMPNRSEPVIATAFRDHKAPDLFDSMIGPEAFFTPEEFIEADHHIQGEFDEFGQFTGTVAVYGREPATHQIAWSDARGQRTLCGPFSINFAYVQGAARESRMPREQWGKLSAKLDRMGGLYIYRNGIRILPYGTKDNDFLAIEERRNLGAAYYFFSARRMFGAIELPLTSSDRLIEKAGREGFRDNRAYRQFREILENFLVELAADFFRDDSALGEYSRIKADIDAQARALDVQARRSRARRQELENTLQDRAARLSSDEPRDVVAATLAQLTRAVGAATLQPNPDARLRMILEAERAARAELAEVSSGLRVPQPRGFALSRALRRNLAAHRAEYATLESEVLGPAYSVIEDMISQATRDLDAGRRRRFDSAAADAGRFARRTVAARSQASKEQLDETSDRVSGAIRQAMAGLRGRSERDSPTRATNRPLQPHRCRSRATPIGPRFGDRCHFIRKG